MYIIFYVLLQVIDVLNFNCMSKLFLFLLLINGILAVTNNAEKAIRFSCFTVKIFFET